MPATVSQRSVRRRARCRRLTIEDRRAEQRHACVVMPTSGMSTMACLPMKMNCGHEASTKAATTPVLRSRSMVPRRYTAHSAKMATIANGIRTPHSAHEPSAVPGAPLSAPVTNRPSAIIHSGSAGLEKKYALSQYGYT
jgi:hypothetical protein